MTNAQKQHDSYGSTMRQHMKASMEKPAPFVPTNRRVTDKRDAYDGAIWWASWVVAVLIVMASTIVLLHQWNMAVRP